MDVWLLLFTVFCLLQASRCSKADKNRILRKLRDFQLRRLQTSGVESINTEMDPCDDFYEYVCHGFKAKNELDNSTTGSSQMGFLSINLLFKFSDILEDLKTSDNLTREETLMMSFYQTCVNVASNMTFENTDLFFDMRRRRADNISYTDYFIQYFPDSVFFGEAIYPGTYNTSKMVLALLPYVKVYDNRSNEFAKQDQAEILKYRKIYEQLQKDDVNETYFKKGKQEIERRLTNVYKISETLIEMFGNIDENTLEHEETTMGQLGQYLTQVDFKRYFKAIAGRLIPPDYDLDELPMEIQFPDIFKKLDAFMGSLTRQEINDWYDQMLIDDLARYMGDNVLAYHQEYENVLHGTAVDTNDTASLRFKPVECVIESIRYFQDVIGRRYVIENLKDDVRQDVAQMIENIKSTFVEMIAESNWMDNQTRAEAIKKAEAISYTVGYTDELYKQHNIAERYADISVEDMETMFEAKHAVMRLTTQHEYRRLFTNDKLYTYNAMQVNAHYYPKGNSLVIQAGILNYPLYNLSSPIVEKYGALGAIIGHEITHGFDFEGSQFDASGTKRNWWTPYSGHHFVQKVECFVEQYDAYKIENTLVHVNGSITVSENVADNGGLYVALRALKKEISKLSEDEVPRLLLGMNYTVEQLFYMSFANLYCDNRHTQSVVSQSDADVHSPHKIRVNAGLSNQQEFLDAFQCKEGSAMYPKKKCKVW